MFCFLFSFTCADLAAVVCGKDDSYSHRVRVCIGHSLGDGFSFTVFCAGKHVRSCARELDEFRTAHLFLGGADALHPIPPHPGPQPIVRSPWKRVSGRIAIGGLE